jgi:DNA-binding transcriptional MerR regulator
MTYSSLNTEAARYYAIGDVAKMTGVPVKTIRYYADIGLLPPARTTEARYRMFGAGEIWRLELIRTLRSFGFGLDEIGQLLAGDLSIREAIEMQLAAVDDQIAQLQRVQQVLTQAKRTQGSADDPLRHLNELGTALHGDVQKRRELLTAKLRAVVNGAALKPDHDEFVRSIAQHLPAEMDAAQSAAWAELVDLVGDPAFRDALQRQWAPFSQASPTTTADWQDRITVCMARATAAHDAGYDPGSAEVQAIADEWLDLFAHAAQQPNTPEFARWVVEHTTILFPDQVELFWTLMSRINGWSAQPSSFAGQRLIIAGVAWRVAQADRDPV